MTPEIQKASDDPHLAWCLEVTPCGLNKVPDGECGHFSKCRTAVLAGADHERKRRRETVAPFNLENMVEGLGRVAEANAHNPTAALTVLAVARLLDRLIEESKK